MTAATSRATANRLLTKFGRTMTLTRRTAGAYSPATGAAITETTQSLKGVVLPLPSIGWALGKLGSTNIVQGDIQILLSALTTTGGVVTEPLVDDRVTAGSNVYTIVNLAPLSPDGTDIVYDCIARGAA